MRRQLRALLGCSILVGGAACSSGQSNTSTDAAVLTEPDGGRGQQDAAPDRSDRDVVAPDAEPDAEQPDAAEPDAAEPDADAAELDAAEPDAAEPDAAEPDAAEPDAGTSDPCTAFGCNGPPPGPAPENAEGGSCSAAEQAWGTCTDTSLFCVYQQCATLCSATRDCPSGFRCWDEGLLNFCFPDCESQADCGTGACTSQGRCR